MIVLRLIGLFFDLLLAPLRLLTRPRAVPDGAFLTLTIDGPVVDLAPRRRFFELGPVKATSIHTLAEVVDFALADARIRGVVVTMKELGAGLATATSLRDQLARLRVAGKEVVVHLPMGGGTKEIYVASVATKLLVAPATTLVPVGFLSATRYFKRALDKVGVEPEVFACGDFKSAGETLVRDSMSEAQRFQLEQLLTTFHDVVVKAIAEGRNVSLERASAMIDGAPYAPDAAVLAGLADGVSYEDEVPKAIGLADAKEEGSGKAKRLLLPASAYRAFMKRPLFRKLRRPPRIAVIPVHGTIAHASGPFGSFSTDERVTRLVRAARADRRVVGVVLHVDSPGGSALASDRMHHEIVQLAREKPLVACMGNVAASGGYYVAAPARLIVCEPTTITGSIGVVAARVSLEPLLSKIGITTETIRRGDHAGLLGSSTPLTEGERTAFKRELDAMYRTFVRVVAEGRKKTIDVVEPLARGRVYAGEEARALDLVDKVGGFATALAELRAMLPEGQRRAEPEVLKVPRRAMPLMDPPSKGDAGRKATHALLDALLPAPERAMVLLAATGERVLALFTGSIE